MPGTTPTMPGTNPYHARPQPHHASQYPCHTMARPSRVAVRGSRPRPGRRVRPRGRIQRPGPAPAPPQKERSGQEDGEGTGRARAVLSGAVLCHTPDAVSSQYLCTTLPLHPPSSVRAHQAPHSRGRSRWRCINSARARGTLHHGRPSGASPAVPAVPVWPPPLSTRGSPALRAPSAHVTAQGAQVHVGVETVASDGGAVPWDRDFDPPAFYAHWSRATARGPGSVCW